MPIVTSTYITDAHSQVGGGRWTIERHTDSTGRVHTVGPYLWDGAADRGTLLAAHAAQLDVQLAQDEAEQMMRS